MQRIVLSFGLALALWPALALAAPSVPELVEFAITALREKSYVGKLRYLTKPSASEESTVLIQHLAPDLYRVTPIVQGLPITSYHYIENAAELVKVQGRLLYPQPERQYAINDALTAKFLRDLGQYPGTELLEGSFAQVPLHILRKDVTRDKPYLITVGLRKDNHFPIFIQIVDAQGRLRLHNQFESIEFVAASSLSDQLFTIPEVKADSTGRAPRVQQPAELELSQAAAPVRSGSGRDARLSSRDLGSGTAIVADLPLYPGWLPDGYVLEAISVLDYPGGKTPSIVYQYEIYGPKLGDLLSVFQMQCDELGDCDFGATLGPPDGRGYLLSKTDDWVVAVFGDLQKSQLQKVIDGLQKSRSQEILRLISQTYQRDRMMSRATEGR
jgi:hypothetical protein